jgi:hypothetical protein
MTEAFEDTTAATPAPRRRRTGLAAAAAGLLVLGGVGGSLAVAMTRPSVEMAPANPVAIASLASGSIVTIRGRVAEVYGNKLIVADASGRALVDTGPAGDQSSLAGVGQAITVQGRFEKGIVRAAFLVGPDGKVTALGPLAPHEHRGPPPHDRPGPDADREAPPPPAAAPAAAAPAATTPAPAPSPTPAT